MRSLVILAAVLCLYPFLPRVADATVPPGELIFLGLGPPLARPKPRSSAPFAPMLLMAAEELSMALEKDIPAEDRERLWPQLAELVAAGWASALPDPSQSVPRALRRLSEGARESQTAAEGLRRVIEVLVDHGSRRPELGRNTQGEWAVSWLERIDGPIATSALLSLSRRSADPTLQIRAIRALADRAFAQSPTAFAEACARLLLE